MSAPSRTTTVRSAWMVLGSTLGVVALALGLSYFGEGTDAFGYVLGVALTLLGAWATVRPLFMSVKVSRSGVRVRGFARTRTYALSSVADVAVMEGHNTVADTRLPVLRLTDDSEVKLTQLSAYSFRAPRPNHPADRRAAALRNAIEDLQVGSQAE